MPLPCELTDLPANQASVRCSRLSPGLWIGVSDGVGVASVGGRWDAGVHLFRAVQDRGAAGGLDFDDVVQNLSDTLDIAREFGRLMFLSLRVHEATQSQCRQKW